MPTKEEIYQRIMQQKQGQKEQDPWYEDFGEGLVVSGQDLVYGLKDLAVGLTDEEKAMLKDWEEDAGESGWGTAGRVTGEIAQFALPSGALKLASKAPKLARAVSAINKTPMARDIVSSTGLGMARLPEEGEGRLQRGMEEGAAALAGGSVGKLLSKATKGVNITPEARELMEEGVRLTPGQAATSKTIRGLESAAEVTPVLAQKTEKLRKRGGDDFLLNILNKANPLKDKPITRIGNEGFEQLQQNVTKGYDDAWSLADNVDKDAVKLATDKLVELKKTVAPDDTPIINNILDSIKKLGKEPSNSDMLKALDRNIGKYIGKTKSNPVLQDALQEVRGDIRLSLPEASQEMLTRMDRFYPDYLVVKKASKAAAKDKGKFDVNQLTGAVKSVGSDTKVAMGKGPLQKALQQGAETVGRKEGGAPLEWFRRLATAFPSVVPVETGMKAALGQTSGQRVLRSAGDPVAEALRKYGITSPRFASALEDDNL